MWRSSLWIVAAITLAGCYQPYSAAPPNPFQGPSRVASPGTRAATNQDYYKDSGGAKQAPTPAAGSSSRNEPAAKGVGDVERSVVINKNKPDAAKGDVAQVGAEDHTDASPVVNAGFHAKVPAAGQQVEVTKNGRPAPPTAPSVIRIVEPKGAPTLPAGNNDAPSQEPGRFAPAKGAVEITDLPKSDRWTGIGKAASGGAIVKTSPPVASGSYGHDKGYRWLKGKLEYTRSADRWKLRYVPIDATTDEHGGSVVLPSDSKLSGFQHGDFVKIDGVLGTRDEASGDFAPPYRVTSIKKQAK